MMGLGSGLWIVAIGLVCFFMWRKGGGCCGCHDHGNHRERSKGNGKTGQAIDPVCGMEVVPSENIAQSRHNGRQIYFCSAHCKEKFDLAPGQFQKTPGKKQAAHGGGCCG